MKVVQSKVREAVGGSFRVSGDLFEALDALVDEAIAKAKQRAEANGRKTLRGYDL